MAETLQQERPSNNDRFRDRVFVRLQDEFIAQYLQDPQTADRALLRQSREEFERYLAQGGTLDAEAVQFGSRLYTTLSDYAALADLLRRYRESGPRLTLSEEAWLRWEYIRVISGQDRCAEVVREQRAFVAWAREQLPGDPPIRLSDPGNTRFRPLRDGEEDPHALPVESIFPWVTNISSIASCFKQEGLQDEWAATARSLIQAAPKVRVNRLHRFWALRNLVVMYYGKETLHEALRATEDIRALTEEENDWEALRWTIEAVYLQITAYSEAGESEMARRRAEEATQLVEEYEARIDASDARQRGSFYILSDNVASSLADRGYDDLAVRLFPRVLANGMGTGWAYVRYAGSLWQQTREREPVLELLRQATPRDLGKGLLEFFRSRAAFADIKDDPEFRKALTIP